MMLNGNETKSNFDFLNKEFPVLANFGRLAEWARRMGKP